MANDKLDHEPKRKPRLQGQAQARQCLFGAEGSPDDGEKAQSVPVRVLYEVNNLRVTVCYAQATHAWLSELTMPPGSTAAQAVAASEFRAVFPDVDPMQYGLAVYGKTITPEQVLRDGDRVDILRALVFDPKESRRRRAAHRHKP